MRRDIALPRVAPLGLACSIALMPACAVDVEEGRGTFQGNAYGPVTKGDEPGGTDAVEDDDSTGDDGLDGSEADAGEASSTGASTSDPTNDSSDPPPDPTGDPANEPPEPGGNQPVSGMYASCLTADQCPGLVGCATVGNPPNDGFCTDHCAGPNNPATCAPSPGGTSTPTCMVLSGYNLCALDCSNGKTCPNPMVCTQVSDEQGTKSICY